MTIGVNLKDEEGYSYYFEFVIDMTNGQISAKAVKSDSLDSSVISTVDGEVIWG